MGTGRLKLGLVALAAATALGGHPGVAAADISELYLRKIRQGEKTFFQAGGWQHWRTRWDVFYEPAYYPGGIASLSTGALVLLTEPRSEHQLTVFTLHSHYFFFDSSSFGYLPLIAPLIPSAFQDGDDEYYEGITGFQFRNGRWFEGAYGLVTGFGAFGGRSVRSFFEANLPLAYLRSSAVVDDTTAIQSKFSFRYDESKSANYLEVGRTRYGVGDMALVHWFADVDRLGGWFSGRVRVNPSEGLGALQAGLHLAKFEPQDQRATGKFGFAWDVKAFFNVVKPGGLLGGYLMDPADADTRVGVTTEVYFQMPAMTWLGVLQMILTAQAAATHRASGNTAEAEKTEREGAEAALAAFNAAEEDDRTYGGMTLGFSYNDPDLIMNEGVIGWHAYIHYRLFY